MSWWCQHIFQNIIAELFNINKRNVIHDLGQNSKHWFLKPVKSFHCKQNFTYARLTSSDQNQEKSLIWKFTLIVLIVRSPSLSSDFFLLRLMRFLKTFIKYSANLLLSPRDVTKLACSVFSFSNSLSMSFFLNSSFVCTSSIWDKVKLMYEFNGTVMLISYGEL